MKRKIVSTFIGPDNSRWQGRLLEVCEDGSIFGWDFSEGKWVEDFPPLPGASDLIHRKPLKQGDIVRFVCEGKIDGFASDDNVIVNMQGCATIINQRDILPDNRDAPDPQPTEPEQPAIKVGDVVFDSRNELPGVVSGFCCKLKYGTEIHCGSERLRLATPAERAAFEAQERRAKGESC